MLRATLRSVHETCRRIQATFSNCSTVLERRIHTVAAEAHVLAFARSIVRRATEAAELKHRETVTRAALTSGLRDFAVSFTTGTLAIGEMHIVACRLELAAAADLSPLTRIDSKVACA